MGLGHRGKGGEDDIRHPGRREEVEGKMNEICWWEILKKMLLPYSYESN